MAVAAGLVAIPRDAVARDEEAASQETTSNTAPSRHGSAFVDPFGFALFGPRVGVEAGAAHFTGALYGRWFNLGVLSRVLFLEDDSEFGLSYGVGVRGRYYLSEGLDALHFGVAAEYLRTHIETPSALIATKQTYIVPQAEVGYRLSFGRFYGDVSGALGYAIRSSGHVENMPGGTAASTYTADDRSQFYGSASLDLGVYF